MMSKTLAVLAVVLLLVVLVSGCLTATSEEAPKSQEEASQAITNMSEDVGEVSSTLEDLEGLFE